MDLVERYLAAIARELPKAQAGDITAELRDTLLSKIEETEQGLGRPLTRPELEAVLKDFGHPLAVAARYGKSRYLIGPDAYPFWLAALRVSFAIAGAVALGVLVIEAATSPEPAQRVIAQATGPLVSGAVLLFGAITLIFVALDRLGGDRLARRWSPRSLPPAGRTLGRPRTKLTTEIVAGVVFILWWTGAIHFRNLFPMPGAIQVDFAPIWIELHWIILAFVAVEMVVNGIELRWPGLMRLNAILSLAKNLAGCALVVVVMRAGHWVVVSAPFPPEVLAKTQAAFDMGFQLGLLVTLITLVAKAVHDVWRFARAGGGAARPNGAANGAAQSA